MGNRAVKKSSHAATKFGLPPGSLVYVGDKRVDKVSISVLDYNESEIHETPVTTADECRQYINKKTVTWINVTGLHDTELLADFGNIFGVHALVLEDILHTGQRPKIEDHDDHIFCVLQMIYRRADTSEMVCEQVSMILGQGFLLTFQEMEGDVFDMLRDRIRSGKGKIRSMGCDYLAYAILDAIVDNCFVVLEDLGEKSEALQEIAIEHPEPETLQAIHRLRRELIFMRRNLWPLREVVAALEKMDNKLIHKALAPYLRDVYGHAIQVIDSVESQRDVLSGALDIYITTVSNRTNDVMKVLTVIATIFIPLTFVVGVYGMNFEHMPELKWPFGYMAVWVVMAAMASGMILYFKRMKWF